MNGRGLGAMALTYRPHAVADTGRASHLSPRGFPMSKLTIISDRALELAEQAGAGLRHAGSSLRDAGIGAEQWIKTGAALGAAKAGFKVARGTVRRHPVAVATAAAVVGAGVLAYVLYRKRRQQQAQEPIEGESRRMPRSNGNASARARAGRTRRPSSTSAST